MSRDIVSFCRGVRANLNEQNWGLSKVSKLRALYIAFEFWEEHSVDFFLYLFFFVFLPSLYTLVFSWTENSTLASVFCCFYFTFFSFNIGFSETQYTVARVSKTENEKKIVKHKTSKRFTESRQRVSFFEPTLITLNCHSSQSWFLFNFSWGFLL